MLDHKFHTRGALLSFVTVLRNFDPCTIDLSNSDRADPLFVGWSESFLIGIAGGGLGASGGALWISWAGCMSRAVDLRDTEDFMANVGLLAFVGLVFDDCDFPEISKDAGEFGGDADEKDDRRDEASSELSRALWRFSIACLIESIKASTPNRAAGSLRG